MPDPFEKPQAAGYGGVGLQAGRGRGGVELYAGGRRARSGMPGGAELWSAGVRLRTAAGAGPIYFGEA